MIIIPYYEDSNFCFSNFSAHSISFKDKTYPTAEHAFHAQKFQDASIVNKIINAKSPLEALQLGKRYKNERRADWDEAKVGILYEILKEKVVQHSEVKETLLATGDEEIIEISPSDFWGNGINGKGQNQCGKILMKIRYEIKDIS
ncbi:MAG: NADAR family protein [bacterium]